MLQNVKEVVKTCHRFGFSVQILNAKMGTPLETLYEALSSADVMLAVHGAALTHFLMMRPGSVLIQIVPLGLDWAAENFYGEPARSQSGNARGFGSCCESPLMPGLLLSKYC